MRKKLAISISIVAVLGGLVFAAWQWLPVAPLTEDPREDPVQRAEVVGIDVETVAENLDIPWAIDFTEDGDIFFTERSGSLRLIEDGELRQEPLLRLPQVDGEGGTLGLALDPAFEENHHLYLYYTDENFQNHIVRYRFNDEELTDRTPIVENIPGAFTHNGGRLAFGPDGMLYAGTGDAEKPDSAQDISSLAGKILRINPDGNPPDDNPYPDSLVYSVGHRNVQGFDWIEAGNMYATEHGPVAQDEVNLIEAGMNYGWPIVAGEAEEAPGIENYRDPLISSGRNTWAPSGMSVYESGDTLPSEWEDTLLFSGLRSQTIWRYSFEDESLVALFDGEFGRLRHVQAAPDGTIYILTSNQDGRGNPADNDDRILRIIPEYET